MHELIVRHFAELTGILASAPGRIYAGTILAFVLLLSLLRRSILFFSIAAFPGTLVHELLHFVVGLVAYARPAGFSVLPRRGERGYVLGSVRFANVRWYNGLLVGLAPLLLLPLVSALLVWRVHGLPAPGFTEMVWAYLLASLVYACVPSWPDIRIAATSIWLVAALAAVYWIATSDGFRVARL